MELRHDIYQKTLELLRAMERVTGYDPGEEFRQSVMHALEVCSDEELPEKFVQITKIITTSLERTAMDVAGIQKETVRQEEADDRTKELEDIASLLHF